MAQINKPAGKRCEHQRHSGCAIYAKRPNSCRLWSCVWLLDPVGTAVLRRPDRSHYVIDSMPDFVTIADDTGKATAQKQLVVQIWIDRRYPDAHRDPALRQWLNERGVPGLIRYSNDDAMVIFPPSVTGLDEWIERGSRFRPEHQHTQQEIAEVVKSMEAERECHD